MKMEDPEAATKTQHSQINKVFFFKKDLLRYVNYNFISSLWRIPTNSDFLFLSKNSSAAPGVSFIHDSPIR